ncbi:hypothetical protein GDO78_001801 [Eleutherodactylus coqui]|uniref:Uncharacterized protein n=1 Tax=Eleutherodactylus coqui TaxID=57060 RepID=A0A8J6KID5_ELECQ|nr:hypothetical protein GDO78_001801 [Eleutherodactylus coqui]
MERLLFGFLRSRENLNNYRSVYMHAPTGRRRRSRSLFVHRSVCACRKLSDVSFHVNRQSVTYERLPDYYKWKQAGRNNPQPLRLHPVSNARSCVKAQERSSLR